MSEEEIVSIWKMITGFRIDITIMYNKALGKWMVKFGDAAAQEGKTLERAAYLAAVKKIEKYGSANRKK